MRTSSLQRKLKSLALVALAGTGAYGVISYCKNDSTFYKNVVVPLVHLLDPEQSHRLGVIVSKYRLIPRSNYKDPDCLKVTIFGKTVSNPIGIAAGFDKNGEAILGLSDMGFGFVEIGSATPEPQSGNDKPRVFRLKQDLAVINRYGFNNDGHASILERLSEAKSKESAVIVGVNLGKNKTSTDPHNDYILGIERFAPLADYLVINVSSPNTPGLRQMQQKSALKDLLKAVLAARARLPRQPPLLVKLAPDLSASELKDVAEVVSSRACAPDGIIISNTTTERPESLSLDEAGGLSGQPLKDKATEMIGEMYKLTKGRIPIVGVGGVFTGQDAFDKIRAGATVVQIYTGLVFEGPPIVVEIKKELSRLLEEGGYKNVNEAVGKGIS